MFFFSYLLTDLVVGLAILVGLNYYFNRAIDTAATTLRSESVSPFSLFLWAIFWPIAHFWASEKN